MTGWQIRLALSALLSIGCGSSTSAPVELDPPTLAITSLTPSFGTPWTSSDPTPAQLTIPCDGRIAVGLEFSNWSPSAPGACGETQRCGHSLVTLSNAADTIMAGAVRQPVLLQLDDVTRWVGSATFAARLVRDDGTDYPGEGGDPIEAAVDADLAASTACP